MNGPRPVEPPKPQPTNNPTPFRSPRKDFMLYNIINPSDPMTFRAPDLQIAALSMFLLSEGKFGADSLEDGGEDVPIFITGGAQAWWGERFDETIDAAIMRRADAIADALDSLVYGEQDLRVDFDAQLSAIEDETARSAFIRDWNEDHRVSDNNIADAAAGISEQLREKFAA